MSTQRPADWPAPNCKIDLEVDDLPHSSSGLEWWYLNMHMTDERGRDYSAFAAFFRSAARDPERADAVCHAHLLTWGLWEGDNERYRTFSALDSAGVEFRRRALRADTVTEPNLRAAHLEVLEAGQPLPPDVLLHEIRIGSDSLDLRYDGATLIRRDGVYHLRTSGAGCGFELTFTPGCDPMLNGADGVLPGRPGQPGEEMFYYTVPRGAVHGSVVIAGERRTLTSGTGWYDHEFGTQISRLGDPSADAAARSDTTWEWGGLHLDDGTDFTFQILHDVDIATDDDRIRFQMASLIDRSGRSRSSAEFGIETELHWTSLATFATYPIQFAVRAPELGIELTVTAVRPQQECVTSVVSSFWEGRVTVRGTSHGKQVSGVGFVEVLPRHTFDSVESFLWRPGEEVRRRVRSLYPDCVGPSGVAAIAGADDPSLVDGVQPEAISASLVWPSRHLVDNGGKTWRPFLFTVALQLCGADLEAYADMMAATELLHVGAMIVDDVEDRSPVRRGVPSTHELFGEPLAINAGTALFFAFDRIARGLADQDPQTQLELYRSFCQTLRLAHTGQALDLLGHRAALEEAIASGDPGPLEQQILAVHRLKTGAPVRGIADGAAVLGRADRKLREAMRSYFCAIGLAYQISDDVWDLAGDQPRPGRTSAKPRTRPLGEDIRTATISFPLAKAVRLLPQARMRQLWQTIDRKPQDTAIVQQCIDTLIECGAVQLAISHAAYVVDQAWRQLSPLVSGTTGATMARALGHYCVYRDNPRPDGTRNEPASN